MNASGWYRDAEDNKFTKRLATNAATILLHVHKDLYTMVDINDRRGFFTTKLW